jgi:hypothetical protein
MSSKQPPWFDDTLEIDVLRQRRRQFDDNQLLAAKKRADEALEKFRNRAKGIDPKRRFFEKDGIATSPALLNEIAKRAGVKSWWTKDEADSLRKLQGDWEDVVFTECCPNGVRARFEGQKKSFEDCSTDELKNFEIMSIHEMREAATDKRRLLRKHYMALTHEVTPIICAIFERLTSACDKVADQIEADEKKLALEVGFKNEPSNFLVAVVTTSWRYRDSIGNIGVFPVSPKSFMASWPGGNEIFSK